VAASCGAEALIRSGFAKKGKTWNVRWALEKIPMDDFDVLAMFDADNLAEADFLSCMNDYMEEHPGADAIQGMLDVKNPDDNWLTMSYATAYWFTNRFWQMARTAWGLSCTMGGTGLVVKMSALRRLGWNFESLTEDLEMSTRLILSGSRVHWNDHAVVYDEKPQSLSASMRQRTRWMRGHYWTLWNYGKPAFCMLMKTRKIQYLDLLMYLLAPVKCCVAVLAFAAGAALTFAEYGTFSTAPLISFFGLPLVTAVAFCALCSILGSSIKHGRMMLGYVRNVPALFWYGLTWLPIIFGALFAAGRQGDWISTEHTRNLSLEQMTRRE
jgi:cellulose synthase/poly-beta-1,6-N-acetylglucosamine synthase-like glycosyltransferase